jgi:hypothetical protein
MGMHQSEFIDFTNAFSGCGEELLAMRWFCLRFGECPSVLHARDLHLDRLMKRLKGEYATRMVEVYGSAPIAGCRPTRLGAHQWFVLVDSVLMAMDFEMGSLEICYRSADRMFADELAMVVKMFRKQRPRAKPTLGVITASPHGLEVVDLELRPSKIDLSQHYNDDFMAVHERIEQQLRKKKNKGLVLLHGQPGTGKTSYIRYLLARLKKRVLFIPPSYAGSLTDPQLLPLLMEHPDSVLVIEDAERILATRNHDGHSDVSVLLNIADGLLSDCLNIQMICTFNTDLSRVDQALLREGRLIARYQFKPLHPLKAEALLGQRGIGREVNAPLTLAQIYHPSVKEVSVGDHAGSPIGFRSHQNA